MRHKQAEQARLRCRGRVRRLRAVASPLVRRDQRPLQVEVKGELLAGHLVCQVWRYEHLGRGHRAVSSMSAMAHQCVLQGPARRTLGSNVRHAGALRTTIRPCFCPYTHLAPHLQCAVKHHAAVQAGSAVHRCREEASQLRCSRARTGGSVRYCSAICTRSSGKFCVGDPAAAGPAGPP